MDTNHLSLFNVTSIELPSIIVTDSVCNNDSDIHVDTQMIGMLKNVLLSLKHL